MARARSSIRGPTIGPIIGWRGRRWEEIVLYELHVGTFSETGDFAGVARHLDHLCRLGVTAVELMPIAEFPGGAIGAMTASVPMPRRRITAARGAEALVEACHARGLAILLDVVYNHFGPEGNYLPAIAPDFFTERHHTPWGAALDFAGPRSRPVRDFFIHNALYWLEEFHFDGLRLDAVHAIFDDDSPRHHRRDRRHRAAADHRSAKSIWSSKTTATRPAAFAPRAGSSFQRAMERRSAPCSACFDHRRDIRLLPATTRPTRRRHLGRALAEGFAYQGEPSPFRGGRPRGEPSAELPATAFVAFLQNHDHVGNHPFGTRLATHVSEAALHAGAAIVLLSPQIPLLFMGEEWASQRPFAFFCDFEPDLAEAVREGRRREFAHFPEFHDEAARDGASPTRP